MDALLGFLDGASPWWWLTLAVALGAAELLLFTVVLLWFAAAAAVVALALILAPGLSGEWQIALFAVLAIALTAVGRAPVLNALGRGSRPELNNRAARLTGRRARVSEAFSGGTGAVELEGVRWRARLSPDEGAGDAPAPDPAQGAEVLVRGHDGPVLLVSSA